METTATTNRNGADTMTTTTKTTTTIRTHRLPSGRKLAWTNDPATGRHTFSGGHYGEHSILLRPGDDHLSAGHLADFLVLKADKRVVLESGTEADLLHVRAVTHWIGYCENNAAHATEVEA